MKIVPLSDGLPDWDQFVALHRGGWFWHTSGWLRYQEAHAGSENLSFALMEGDYWAGLCVLLREGDCFRMEGHPLPIVLLARLEAGEAVSREIAKLARECSLTSIAFRTCPLVEEPALTLAGDGWRDISWPSRILDLSKSESELHAGVRKSYRHLINRGRQTWERWDCAGSPEAFHVLWGEVNGRRRHPQAEALMSEWLKTGYARLLGAWRGGRWEAFCYAIVYKRRAYYASGPSLVPGAMHALQWEMILALKAEGVELYELGWQARPGDSDKDRGIARFKAGFGGEDRMVQAVERDFREASDAH